MRTLLAMQPPDDAIETTSMTVWIDDGIVCFRSRGVPSTRETVIETLGVVGDLVGGAPKPVLFDARAWPSADPQSWSTFISKAEGLFSAAAVIVGSESLDQLGGFPDVIDRLLVPFKVFTDEAEALAFLRDATDD